MATVGEPMQISSHTVDKVAKAKLTLETYYSNLVAQHAERENRCVWAMCQQSYLVKQFHVLLQFLV